MRRNGALSQPHRTSTQWPQPRQMQLAELQRLFYRLVVAPNGVAEGLAHEASLPADGLTSVIVGDDRLAAEERLDIYANAYFYRLLDVLKEDFPATLAVLGETDFHNLVTGYLIENPPTEPSIAFAGQHLPAFLRQHPFKDRRPFIGDLARLERTLIESFCAADHAPLDATSIRATAAEEWPSIRMQLHPASRLLELEYPVEVVLRSVERGEPWADPMQRPETILVWRRNAQVFYRTVEVTERAALTLAQEGASFATLCEVIAARCDEPDPAGVINRILSRWIADEVFVRPRA